MRRGAIPPQPSRNAAGALGKPPSGSRIPASRCVEDPQRCYTESLLGSLLPRNWDKGSYGYHMLDYIHLYVVQAVGTGPVQFHVSGIWTRYRRCENNFTLLYLEGIRKPVLRSGFKPDEGR